MWKFTIKTEGTFKARLVGRGDLMIPSVHFNPNKTYCGNVSATSIKIALTIAAKYKLTMRGNDLEGAYLVTKGDKNYLVLWPCQDLGTGSRTAGSGSEGKEAGRAIAMETMWLAYR